VPQQAPFRILGWNTNLSAIWVQTGQTGIVASIPPTKNGLQRIAPLPYWEALYPGRTGPGWDAAIGSICQQAHDLGQTFTPDRIRGRGVWLDNNRVVWHLGNRLEVDGQLQPLTALRDSGWTYASLPALEIDPYVAPLSDAEGSAILALIHNRMQWENAGGGLLIAGHAVLGNICGALDIRPGLQLTGPSRGGKSTTERTISRLLQGGLGVRPSGATEAGIRQRMQSDALPVVIDESEQESPKVREGHLKLLRLSFDGQELIKGTPGGGQALTYTMRSSITLIGINAAVPNLADRNRLVVIRPRKIPPAQWPEFQLQRDALITVETGRRLIRRSVFNLKALVANIKTFQAVVAGQGLADRSAEVYGSLLAGAHHLTSTAVLAPAEAIAWLASVGWTGIDQETQEAIATDAEGLACLEHLLGHSVPWKCSQTGSIAVLELLKIAQGLSQTMGEDNASELNKAEAVKALGRLGVKLDSEHGMVVSKACTVFSSTRWANGAHHDRLLELKGAKPLASPVRFPQGRNARGVSLPIELVDPEP
jgi:putative DNA primase/helicase